MVHLSGVVVTKCFFIFQNLKQRLINNRLADKGKWGATPTSDELLKLLLKA